MITPELRSISAPFEWDLETYRPADDLNYVLSLDLNVGLTGEDGTELFELTVWTPKSLETELKPGSVIWGNYCLIARNYDLGTLKKYIRRYIAGCSGASWDEIIDRIGVFASPNSVKYYDSQEPIQQRPFQCAVNNLVGLGIGDLQMYRPPDLHEFDVTLHITVESPNSPKFHKVLAITACSPSYFLRKDHNALFVIARHHLIMFEYNFPRIQNAIRHRIEQCSGIHEKAVLWHLEKVGRALEELGTITC